jgi:hypothetical protein
MTVKGIREKYEADENNEEIIVELKKLMKDPSKIIRLQLTEYRWLKSVCDSNEAVKQFLITEENSKRIFKKVPVSSRSSKKKAEKGKSFFQQYSNSFSQVQPLPGVITENSLSGVNKSGDDVTYPDLRGSVKHSMAAPMLTASTTDPVVAGEGSAIVMPQQVTEPETADPAAAGEDSAIVIPQQVTEVAMPETADPVAAGEDSAIVIPQQATEVAMPNAPISGKEDSTTSKTDPIEANTANQFSLYLSGFMLSVILPVLYVYPLPVIAVALLSAVAIFSAVNVGKACIPLSVGQSVSSDNLLGRSSGKLEPNDPQLKSNIVNDNTPSCRW